MWGYQTELKLKSHMLSRLPACLTHSTAHPSTPHHPLPREEDGESELSGIAQGHKQQNKTEYHPCGAEELHHPLEQPLN